MIITCTVSPSVHDKIFADAYGRRAEMRFHMARKILVMHARDIPGLGRGVLARRCRSRRRRGSSRYSGSFDGLW